MIGIRAKFRSLDLRACNTVSTIASEEHDATRCLEGIRSLLNRNQGDSYLVGGCLRQQAAPPLRHGGVATVATVAGGTTGRFSTTSPPPRLKRLARLTVAAHRRRTLRARAGAVGTKETVGWARPSLGPRHAVPLDPLHGGVAEAGVATSVGSRGFMLCADAKETGNR